MFPLKMTALNSQKQTQSTSYMIHSVGPFDVETEERVGHETVPKDVPVKVSETLKSRRALCRSIEITHDKPP